jgi:phage recombination protein Bet
VNNLAKIEQHQPKRSLIDTMSAGYSMDPANFAKTVRATCMPANSSDEEFAAFLLVAHQHGLNPVTREIYAFPKKGGGIQPIVGIDGWMTLINSHPQSDGLEFIDAFDDKGKLSSITCKIYRKDRNRPTEVTEYMNECARPTEPWQKWPARMLRHKAAIQCARYAVGFAGIIDPEEAERSPEVITGTVIAPPPQIAPPKHEDISVITTDGQVVGGIAEIPDAAEFFTDLETQMAGAMDAPTIEEVWTALDPEGTFDGDDINLDIAHKIKHRRLAQINPLGAG